MGFILFFSLSWFFLSLAVTAAVSMAVRAYALAFRDAGFWLRWLLGGLAEEPVFLGIRHNRLNIDPIQETTITPTTHVIDLSTSIGMSARWM
jgi:hypothetical protein